MSLDDTLKKLKERTRLLNKTHGHGKAPCDDAVKENCFDKDTRKISGKNEACNHTVPPTLFTGDVRSIVSRVTAEINAKCGIDTSETINKKLTRLFESKKQNGEDLEKYVARLERSEASSPDWQIVMNAIVVHESYFYRDKAQMDNILREALLPFINEMKDKPYPTLRIWTAACSSGEETYTMAMMTLKALLDANQAVENEPGNVRLTPGWTIEILGTDISGNVIARAGKGRYGTYGLSSFRDMPKEFKRFFKDCNEESETGGDYLEVNECVRKMTRFETHNILSGAYPGEGGYDIVFCRNVMIYFDEQAKLKAQSMLADALKPGGYLALGPSDTLMIPERFEFKRRKDTVFYKKL